MRRALGLVAWLSLNSCLQIGTDAGNGAGQGTGSLSAADPTAPAEGVDCGTDPTGQVVLCEQVTLCPSVIVDPGVYPSCGFRIGAASTLDVECVCGELLCPLGSPQSCADVSRLLAAQSALSICEQATLNLCAPLVSQDAGATSSCTPSCQSQCGGVPDCLVACGC